MPSCIYPFLLCLPKINRHCLHNIAQGVGNILQEAIIDLPQYKVGT
jgi:hypothetical protein